MIRPPLPCLIKISAAMMMAVLTQERAVAVEQPLLRFVQWNDVHASGGGKPVYTLANEKLNYLVNVVNEGTLFPTPDFVIGIGDMTDAKLTADFDLLKTTLAQLKCPYYPVVGNHEIDGAEGNKNALALYIAAFGADHVNYTFRSGGIQFVVFDNSAGGTNTARDQWICGVFEASPGIPKILCCHVPLAPVREETVLAKSFGFGHYYATVDPQLLGMVEKRSQNVAAVLSGHLHLTGAVKQNGVYHIVASGTGSYPCDFVYYEVFHDHIRVQMFTLPGNLRTKNTDIHGPPRWPTAYADFSHPTHEAYMSGNPAERSFDIPIRPLESLKESSAAHTH